MPWPCKRSSTLQLSADPMHLLRTQPGGFVPDDSIADLGQTPAELVILCSGDSSLALLAEAARQLPDDYPSTLR